MPLPASINDLSTTAASNSPAGSESSGTADDYLRTYAAYIASLRDVVLSGTASVSTLNITYTGTLTGGTGVVNIGSGQVYKDASGKIGLGTTSPAQPLHVKGSTRVEGVTYFHDLSDATRFGYMANTYMATGSGSKGDMFLVADSNLLIGTNGSTERIRIDVSGNVTVSNTGSVPGTPTGGGVLYVESGALKYKGSSGTVTILGAA